MRMSRLGIWRDFHPASSPHMAYTTAADRAGTQADTSLLKRKKCPDTKAPGPQIVADGQQREAPEPTRPAGVLPPPSRASSRQTQPLLTCRY